MAKLCGIEYNGIAVGSYARKLVNDKICCDDFYNNDKIFNESLEVAQNLVRDGLK